MTPRAWKRVLACALSAGLLQGVVAWAEEFSFGVIARPFRAASAEAQMREAIRDSDQANLAFVVTQGLKASEESCGDALYQRRKSLLNEAKNGIIVSPAASDWAECRQGGRSIAIARLNRLRELFFSDEFSLGDTRIPLSRQSTSAKFRGYGENAKWEIGDILFATMNLPDNNNHYLPEAGRNSEFEDRLIANRDWLHRIFVFATLKKSVGVVIFCDGNPFAKPRPGVRRDGFTEIRQQILSRAGKFPGKTLLVFGKNGPRTADPHRIQWQGKLGLLEVHAPWITIHVQPSLPDLFMPEAEASPPVKPTGGS